VTSHLRADAASARRTVLTHRELNAHNTFDRPDAVVPESSALEGRGRELRCILAATSLNRLDIRLA
jgi:alpha-N-arabinofuranosidase